jgi:3-hydroxyisobutyrate dehydrogenase-like beta-hydroxyacid dehydrogenase
MNIVMETAKALGLDLEVAALATQHLQELVQAGKGELDSSAIKEVIQQYFSRATSKSF